MLLTVTWPANRPSTSIANGSVVPWRAARASRRTRVRKVTGRGGEPGGAVASQRHQPGGVALAGVAPGVEVGAAQRAQRAPIGRGAGREPVGRRQRPAAAQWSLPTTCSTACTRIGRSTASPSFTPPREPGRLTTRQSPTTPARPRDSTAVGTPFGGAGGADRLGDAGHLAVEQRPGLLGGAVGRGQAGAAGGEHDAARPRRRRRAMAAPTGSPSGRRPARRPRSPSSCRAATMSGPVSSA